MGGFRNAQSSEDSDGQTIDPRILWGAQAYVRSRQRREPASTESLECWNCFYLICDSHIRRYAHGNHIRPGDFDDVVQSAWKEVTASLPDFQSGPVGQFFAWLSNIVHTTAARLRRHRLRHPASSLERGQERLLLSETLAADVQEELNEELLQSKQTMEELQKAVSPFNFRIFYLRCVEGQSIGEVAKQLQLTAEQVRSRSYRVRKTFRRMLEDDDGSKAD
jgi:RNA polymerase sigma factor (sigma-70 family)